MNDKTAELRAWVEATWPDLTLSDFSLRPEFHAAGDDAPKWQALSGDAGFRRYFRLASEPPLLAVHAPVESENAQAFMDISRLLRQGGVLAPAVAACDLDNGYLLIEDLGPRLLLDVLDESSANSLYAEALDTLLLIQKCPADEQLLPRYDRPRLRDEMALFPEWFVQQLLGCDLSEGESRMLDRLFAVLEDSALQQPQVLVHRDYHSRNLVYRPEGPPGVIDFQDAVVGPYTYDLVSLLRDCYQAWPEARVQQWALSYAQRVEAAGLAAAVPPEQFLRWFDLMGLQRHIKVLGIFARLSLRDGKHGYLKELPRVLAYVLQVAQKYDEAQPFLRWYEQRLEPLVQAAPWYKEFQLP